MINTLNNDTISMAQIEDVKSFSIRLEELKLEMALFDTELNVKFATDSLHSQKWEQCNSFVTSVMNSQKNKVFIEDQSPNLCGVPLFDDERCIAIIITDVSSLSFFKGDLSVAKKFVGQMLLTFAESFEKNSRSINQIELVSSELAQTYEELMLLYKMSTNMQVTQSDANFLQMACDNLTDIVSVEGIAIMMEREVDGQARQVIVAGSGLITVSQDFTDMLDIRLNEAISEGKEALLDSNAEGFKYDWPEMVRSIILVPLRANDKVIGILIAINRIGKADFDSIDLKLFSSVAHECAVFIDNGNLFRDLKELFIGSLMALTNSIDAKDQYTRGHSERVAFISRWISERLNDSGQFNITKAEIHQIYLSGLLHDIGKIGISESVLCKEGSLDDAEWKQIQSHPAIGASILSDIKQMKDIIPGVLCHHERVDGKGYPNGLSGDSIPLISKVINLADAFDAMTSRRTYRDAMSIRRALDQIQKGLGTQFDQTIGEIFLSSDINQLWTIIQDGFIESWDYSNFEEYGTDAVGALLR